MANDSEVYLAGMQENWGGVFGLGAGLAGEVTRFGVHTAFNLGAGHGWDSFGRGFDDMGGLTLNLMNAGVLAGMFGADAQIANNLNVGLFELNISRHGLSSRFGTGGIDVSRALYDIGRWGVSEISRRMAERNTETANQQPDDDLLFEQERERLEQERVEYVVRSLTQEEIKLYREALERAGITTTFDDFYSIVVIEGRLPTPQELYDVLRNMGLDKYLIPTDQLKSLVQDYLSSPSLGAMALPDGRIFVPSIDPNSYLWVQDRQKALVPHEVHHIAQFMSGEHGAPEKVFARLVVEGLLYQAINDRFDITTSGLEDWILSIKPDFHQKVREGVDPYRTSAHGEINFLEFDAQRVDNAAFIILHLRRQQTGQPVLFGN